MESYKYVDLRGEQSFRLLHLQPGTDPKISIRLQEYAIHHSPSFEALSYTWHTPEYEGLHKETIVDIERTEAIICEDQAIYVTPNCYSALLVLRQPDTARVLWVDALCINQGNISERSRQVLLMHSIYSRSAGVLCWIGDGNEHIPTLFEYIKTFVAHAQEPYRLSQLVQDEETIAKYDAALSAFKETRSAMCVPWKEAQNTPLWWGIISLHQRSYWDRAWVLQELRAAPKRTIVCGQNQIDYHDLESFMIADRTLDTQAERHSSADHQYPRSWVQRFLNKFMDQLLVVIGGNDISALETLIDGQPFLSTDARDKIFALVGLSDQLRELVPLPDYSQSCAEIYTAVAAALLECTKSLDLLYCCFGQACEPGLPSWVPDWSSAERPWWRNHTGASRRFKATNDISPWAELQKDGKSLKVKGVIIDKIASVAEYYDKQLLGMSNGIRQGSSADTWEEEYGTDNFFLTYPYAIWRKWCDMSNTTSSSPWKAGEGPEGDQLWFLFNAIMSDSDLHQGYSVWREILEHEKLSPVQRAKLIATFDKVDQFNENLTDLVGLTLCTTEAKRLALVPYAAREGDKVALIAGCSLPFTLRPVVGGYSLIGASYVYSVMQGEAVTDTEGEFATIVLAGDTEVDEMARLDS